MQKEAEEREKTRQVEVRNIRDKNKAVDRELKNIVGQFKKTESMAKEASERMTKALKEKDMSGISTAHELQELVRKRNQNACENMVKLNAKKRKLTEQLEKYAEKKRV